jgi:hypothetical protein
MFAKPYEPVGLAERRYGLFPSAFIWRGRRFPVEAIEECRFQKAHRLLPGRKELHILVLTPAGHFELIQNVGQDAWRILRPQPLDKQPIASSKPRYPLPFRKRRSYRLLRKSLSRLLRERVLRSFHPGYVLNGRGAMP